ncbi:MAG: tRNA uridine-5-carboxymethylaminomethyl(34) synthesis GTPase MnmE [Gammaproteobacteria bacterium]
MQDHVNTIAAVATPPGKGGVGIVRVSGPRVPDIARTLCGDVPEPRRATLCVFQDAQRKTIDQGLALYFPQPHSFTGEHILELHGHGGPVVLDLLLARVLELGARLARPGEFSERAFLNDKLDLLQAEAVADLIEATTSQAAQAAVRSLQGEFSRRVRHLLDALVQLRMYVEAALDFPEEEIDFLSDARVEKGLKDIDQEFCDLLQAAKQGCLLRDGMTVVISGRPNAGKSSLLNALVGRDRAIVTAVPGTTRDVLQECIDIDGMPMHVIDTAGLHHSENIVEREGVRRAWAAIESADRVLIVVDDQLGLQAEDKNIFSGLPADVPYTVIYNKIDLTDKPAGLTANDPPSIAISALTGAGLDVLRAHLTQAMGYQEAVVGEFSARRRHIDALHRAHAQVNSGRNQLEHNGAGELLAEELRQAQLAINEITGEFTNDDLLGEIFAGFCIGK